MEREAPDGVTGCVQQSTRKNCVKCGRAADSCYCRLLISLNNAFVPVVILRHSDEVKKPLGTARIAKLSLSHCQLIDGVDYSDNPDFQSLINQADTARLALLYPGENATPLQPINLDELHASVERGDNHRAFTLIVVDGTWRNTREILLANPILQSIPKVTMSFPVSRYTVRKSPAEECVSTIEALACSLDYLYNGQGSFLRLLDAFDYMVDYQIKRMGQETFARNYLKQS